MKFKLWILLTALLFIIVLVFTWNSGYFTRDTFTWKMAHTTSKAPSDNLTTSISMDLYLRLTTAKQALLRYYESLLVLSMRYFWPDHFSMVVVFDNERQQDHSFAENIRQTFPFPRTCFMDPITGIKYSGKDRMQRDMFYPERCTSKQYVGYLDTDTVFTSRVIPDMLFEEGKPIVVGIYGNISNSFWGMAAKTTAKIFKTKEVMRCMSNFPVIMKVEHMIKLRKYVETLHNMTFHEILQKKKVGYISQFNLMCQYIWLFHRDEYKFYLNFNKKVTEGLSQGREDHKYYNQMLTPEQLQPFARFCVHYKYYDVDGNWKSQATYTNLFKSSICFMGGFDLCPDKCTKFQRDSLRKAMFVFDFVDWTWDSRCLAAQQKHYKQLAKYDNPGYSNIIRNACKEVDNLIWKP